MRYIQREIETAIVRELIRGGIVDDATVDVAFEGGEVVIKSH